MWEYSQLRKALKTFHLFLRRPCDSGRKGTVWLVTRKTFSWPVTVMKKPTIQLSELVELLSPGVSYFSCYGWERKVGTGAPSSVKMVAGLSCYSPVVMSNTLAGTAPSPPWSTPFLSCETTQGRPFRRKVEREGHAYLDSETISDQQGPVLTAIRGLFQL